MKNSRKTILPALIVVLMVAMLALCACQSTTTSTEVLDNAEPPELTPIKASGTTLATDLATGETVDLAKEVTSGNINDQAYDQAWADVCAAYPYAERDEKVAYALEARSNTVDFLTGAWQPSDEVVEALEQSQDEILALIESGENSPRLDPYNLGNAEMSGGHNDNAGPGPAANRS